MSELIRKNNIASWQFRSKSGATMVEFALMALVFFSLVALIVDTSFTLMGYTELQTRLITASEKGADNLAKRALEDRWILCSDYSSKKETFLQTTANDAAKNLGIGMNCAISPSVQFQVTSYSVRMEADCSPSCFFCLFWPSSFRIQLANSALIEDRSFTCSP